MRMDRIAFWTLAALLSCLVVAAATAVDFLPTNDGPQHIFASYVVAHLDDASKGYGRYLQEGSALSNHAFDSLYRTLLTFLSWRAAHQVAIAVMALAWAWGSLALALVLGRRWLGLLGFAAAYQWLLYMGFYSFFLTSGLGLLIIAFACSPRASTAKGHLLLGLALFCQVFLHAFACFLTGSVVAIVLVARASRGRRLAELGRVALLGAPATVVFLLVFLSERTAHAQDAVGVAGRLRLLGGAFVVGPWWRAWPMVVLALGGATYAVARFFLPRTAPAPNAIERGLLAAGLVLLCCAIALPVNLPTWQLFCVRFTPLAITLLLFLLPVERLRRGAALGARAGISLFAGLALVWAIGFNRQVRNDMDVALSGLDADIARNGPRLDLILEMQAKPGTTRIDDLVPFCVPTTHLGVLYAVAQGGVTTRVFSDPDKHMVNALPQPKGPVPEIPPFMGRKLESMPRDAAGLAARRRIVDDLLSFAPGYQDVIMFGLPSDVEALIARRFDLDYRRDGLAIARFHPCPVTLDLVDVDTQPAPAIISTAWQEGGHVRTVAALPGGRADQVPRQHALPDSPCGQLFVRVLFDRDQSGGPSPGDAVCAAADRHGFVRFDLRPDTGRITCVEPPR